LNGTLDDLDFVLAGATGSDVRDVYARAAERYDHFRDLWLRLAGQGAENAMFGDVADRLSHGVRVLDAGCGTGAMARRILARESAVDLTLIDLSPEMLVRAADLPGEHIVGSVLDLPFPDERFDIVLSAWVIETLPDPRRAVSEYLRVLRPGGRVVYTFCSLPDGWLSRGGSAWLRAAVRRGFAGEFLPEERIPWHDCDVSHRLRFQRGLTTEIALGSCCSVGDGVLPFR